MNNINDLILQQAEIENTYSKKLINDKVLAEILACTETCSKIDAGIDLLISHYKDKLESSENENRKIIAKHMLSQSLVPIVTKLMIMMLIKNDVDTLTTYVGRLRPHLKIKDTQLSLIAAAELIVILGQADLYWIMYPNRNKTTQWACKPCFSLDNTLLKEIQKTMFMPPMICPPVTLEKNNDSTYLTFEKDSQILGRGENFHMEEICLEHLNTLNSIPLTLNEEMLNIIKETPSTELNAEAQKNFDNMQKQSTHVYNMILEKGNVMYIPWKTDTRGRTYSQGYHVNPQGTPFKKSIIDFHQKEIIK